MTIYNKLNLWIACCVAVEAWYAQGTLYIGIAKGAWLVKGAKCLYGCATCAWKGSRYTVPGTAYDPRRCDWCASKVKQRSWHGRERMGSLTWDCFNICFALLCHHPFLLLERRDLLALVACSLSYSSHWSGKDCEEEEEEELCLPSRGGSNYL